MALFDAEQALKTLPSDLGCTVSYSGTSLSPAAKTGMEGEWQTGTEGVAGNYEFSVWVTASDASSAGVKHGKKLTVDDSDYKIMNIDKSGSTIWRIDLESIHA